MQAMEDSRILDSSGAPFRESLGAPLGREQLLGATPDGVADGLRVAQLEGQKLKQPKMPTSRNPKSRICLKICRKHHMSISS